MIRITAETLSGIPSIVYGLFGMLFFVTALHWGMSLLAGACTLVIMVLPLIMRTAEEALKAVPDSYREASFGLGLVSCVQSLLSYFHQQFLESWQESSFAIGRIHWRNGSTSLYIRNSCSGPESDGIRPYTGSSYVCTFQ